MKKIILCTMMLTLLIFSMAVSSFAAETLLLSVSEQTAQPGEQVSVTISVENNPGIASLKFNVSYDSALTLTNITFNSAFGSMVTAPEPYANPEPITMISPLSDITANGVFATLTFTVSDNVDYGYIAPITVTYNAEDIYNGGYTTVPVSVVNGSITIQCSHSDTKNVPEAPADCDESGYTAGVWCNDCQTYISGHEYIPETGDHADADDDWETDEVRHFRTCDCGHTFDSDTHNGGNATCTQKAICSTCNAEYGEVNSDNHTGGTTTVNKSTPDHKTQTDGYSGDIKCLGCGEIITYGQTIKAEEHVPANNWSFDEERHWKICRIPGCETIISGSEEQHISTGSNAATCETLAKCDVCHTSYGDFEPHSYTAKDKNDQTLKTSGNCRDEAVYYYSCSACSEVENNDNHTFLGDKVSDNHVGGTTLINQAEANHKTQTDGYTGDTQCLGCNEIISYGQDILPTPHTVSNIWKSNEAHHWKECTVDGCGVEIDNSKKEHSSTETNVATCQKASVCDVCSVSYGTVASHDWNTSSLEKDASGHWHKCNTSGCTEKDAFAEHTPNHQGGATEEYAIQCTICQFEIEAQLEHTHIFDKEVVEDRYFASKTNCTDPAKYYKSCKCGEKGTETFTSGEKLGHTEGTAWEKDATNHWHICSVADCGAVIESSKTAHNYSLLKYNNAGHWYECECGARLASEDHSGGIADCDNKAKCDICQQEYGSVNHNTVHVPKVEATAEQDGNIEYWYCENCDGYFADAECNIKISYENTIIKYRVLTDCDINGHKFITSAVNESVHAKICTNKCGVIILAFHSFDANHKCIECGMVLNVTEDEDLIEIEQPIESTEEESKETVSSNPETGIAYSLVTLSVCFALVMFKRQ